MKYQAALKWLIPPIILLASFAILMGLFYETPGAPYPITNFRGEEVMINGHGLYYYDTVSSAAQMQGNDFIALILGMPLLVISSVMAGVYPAGRSGSLRGRLLLAGTLGFFLYTYLSMSMLTAYNMLFLVYVALFTMSLYAFILCMLSFDLADLPRHFSDKLPRGWIAGVLFAVGGFLSLAWVGRVVTELLNPQIPAALENTTTRVIQALDLSLIAPLTVLAGIMLLKRSAWGYLLASVAVFKGLSMAMGVSAMAINMALKGVPDSMAVMVPFLVLTVLNVAAAVLLLRNIRETV
jgi:hypothetical protein